MNDIDEDALTDWMVVYARNLEWCVRQHPPKYAWGINQLPEVIRRMRLAFISGSFNKNGDAIVLTCRHFGLPHTYRAIRDFLADRKDAT